MMICFDKLRSYVRLLIKNGMVQIFAGSFASKFVSFFASAFLVRVLSKTEYGVLSYIDNIYNYIYLFAGYGVANAILRYVIIARDEHEKKEIFNYSITSGSIFNLFLVFAGIIFCVFFPHNRQYSDYIGLMVVMVISIPFRNLIDYTLNFLRACFKNGAYAFLSFLTGTLIVVFRYIGALIYELSGVAWGNAIIILFISLICLSVVKKITELDIPKYQKRLTNSRKVNIYSIQCMFTSGLWALFILNDILIMSMFGTGPDMLADYRVAYYIPANFSIISVSIGTFIAPFFTKHEANRDYPWVKKNYFRTIFGVAILVIPISIICLIFAEPIIILLYGRAYSNVVPTMRVLIIGSTINCIFRYSTANILAAIGKVEYNLYISIVCIIIQAIADVIIIDQFGMIGIAIVSSIIYIILSILLIFALWRYIYKSRKETSILN